MKDFDTTGLDLQLLPAVLDAARVELHHFSAGVEIERKVDKTPVTVADREAEAIILAGLARHAPGIPVVAEEMIAAGATPRHEGTYFVVDALDGTSSFIQGKPEFSINIGLVRDQKPVFGLIYVPPTGALYVTRGAASFQASIGAHEKDSAGASYRQLKTRASDAGQRIAFNSRSSGGLAGKFLAAIGAVDRRPIGSSIKFGLIAAGEGDIYARFGETHEWDTAAGQAILEAAGGSVTTVDGASLRYTQGRPRYLNPHFIAWCQNPLLSGAECQRLAAAGAI